MQPLLVRLNTTRVEPMRLHLTFYSLAALIAVTNPTLAQTAGEGSGSEAVGAGAMVKSPEHAEKGGDTDRNPKEPDQSRERSDQPSTKRSDEEISAGSPSPTTAPK